MTRRPFGDYRSAFISIALLWLVGLMSAVHAAEPPDTPFLRIETGMHTAMIQRIDVDAAERYLVTASERTRKGNSSRWSNCMICSTGPIWWRKA